MNWDNNKERKSIDFRELFDDHNSVLFLDNFNDIEASVDNNYEVLVLTPYDKIDKDLE